MLGSKKVKAISVDDTDGPGVTIARPETFQAASKAVTDGVVKHPLTDGLRALGTSLLVGLMNEMGGLSTRNFSTGRFVDAEKIGGESLAAAVNVTVAPAVCGEARSVESATDDGGIAVAIT